MGDIWYGWGTVPGYEGHPIYGGHRPGMGDTGRVWRTPGYGGHRPGMGDTGRVWGTPAGYGGHRPGMGDTGRVWGTPAGYGGHRPGMGDTGRVWGTPAGYGGHRPGMGDTGRVWGTPAGYGGHRPGMGDEIYDISVTCPKACHVEQAGEPLSTFKGDSMRIALNSLNKYVQLVINMKEKQQTDLNGFQKL